MPRPKYYQLVEQGDTADLYIFGRISQYTYNEKNKDGYSIVKELQDVKAENITIHINSPGGDAFEGLAIYNVLKNSGKKVTTICEALAASAASLVFCAGAKRIMRSGSIMMIHNVWTVAAGDANALRKEAEDLDTITSASVAVYKATASITEKEIREKMDKETWMTAEEAKKIGLATEVDAVDDEDVSQDAMEMITSKLLAEPGHEGPAAVTFSDDDIEKLAGAVAGKLAEKKEEKAPTDEHGWAAFFG